MDRSDDALERGEAPDRGEAPPRGPLAGPPAAADTAQDSLAPGAPAHPSPAEVATRFYDAFLVADLEAMERLYAPDVTFRDEVFKYSDRRGTMKMWRDLLGSGNGTFSYRFERTEGEVAISRWFADYVMLGRPVHNEIESRLTVREGRIVRHSDSFSWSDWSRQAFPLGGLANLRPVRWLLVRAIRTVVG